MKDISIIIPAYNEEKYIRKCLESLKNQTISPLEVIVVDNNSIDKTVKIAKEYSARVLHCEEQGISSARNYGAKKAKGDLICFIDADGIVSEKWVERLIENYNKKPDLSAISGANIFDSNNIPKFVYYNLYNLVVFPALYLNNKMKNYFIVGNNMAIDKKVFFDVGGFPKYVAEDIWLSRELRKDKSIKIAFDPKMTIKYSTRRFNKKGFLKTIGLWICASSIKKIEEKDYKEDY